MNDTAQKPVASSTTDEGRTVIDMSKMSEGQRAAFRVRERSRLVGSRAVGFGGYSEHGVLLR